MKNAKKCLQEGYFYRVPDCIQHTLLGSKVSDFLRVVLPKNGFLSSKVNLIVGKNLYTDGMAMQCD